MSRFNGVFPIGDTNPYDLPFNNAEETITYYKEKLGFSLKSSDELSFTLTRDKVSLSFRKNLKDPEQESCYFQVEDLEQLYEEFLSKDIIDLKMVNNTQNGQKLMWLKDPFGICYCLGEG